jgi:hypothetical protein
MTDLSILDYCPELKRLHATCSMTGRSGKKFDSLGALSSLNNVITIRNLMLQKKPAFTLEVGMAFGGSALTIAATHAELKHEPNAQHHVMDPYQMTFWDECALVALERAGLRDFVDFRPLHSWLALSNMIQEGIRIDMAYIDGSHLFEDAFVDWFLVARILAPNGIVLFDDCADPHVRKVLKFLRCNLAGSFTEIDLFPYRMNSSGRVKYQIAKILGKVQLRAFQLKADPEREWNALFGNF